jgi:trehalose-6-phosphate synthase
VTLVQLVIPSREDIPEYNAMKDEIERLVGEISGEFMHVGWSPIHYRYGQWDRDELVAHYSAARVALVTPLKDGMNLVAKEYCAASTDGDGVLVLSEHAGAAAQLQADSLMVNPYDVDGMARAIHRACTMKEQQRRERMARLRERVRREDIHWWAHAFLDAARPPKPAEAQRRRVRRGLALPGNFMRET